MASGTTVQQSCHYDSGLSLKGKTALITGKIVYWKKDNIFRKLKTNYTILKIELTYNAFWTYQS